MSDFLQHYTLSYTPLSPIHIGTGDSYEPTNYVIDDGTLYEFDTGGALAALTETDRNELNRIVNARANEDMLKAVQRFFYDRRAALKPWAINAIPVLDGVANLYGKRVGQTANREGGGSQVLNKLEIDRTAYNPINRQPVLFGSSIKGAIRTALLAKGNGKEPLRQIEDHRTGRKRKENNQELQQRLFDFRSGKFELDPLRLLQIGDAAWDQKEALPTAQILLAVNRKKDKVLDQNKQEQPSQAEKKDLYQQLECLPAWGYRSFSGQLGLQQLSDLPNSADTKLPKENLRFTFKQIAQSCQDFYEPILQAEMKILRERGFIDEAWDNNIRQLLANMQDRFIKGEAFLLRVGRHSGAEAVTLNGVRDIKIMEEKDKNTGKQKFSFANKTKTLWLAAEHKDQRQNLLPFGWLLVEIHPGNEPIPDFPELEALCAGQQQAAKQWAEKHARQQAELSAKRQAMQQQWQREAEQREVRRQRDLEAQQAVQAAQEIEAQRRASMTEEQLHIETLRQSLQQKLAGKVREQIGGPLYGDLRLLIDQTDAWPPEAKAELLELGKAILTFIDASCNKKAKELLKKLQ